MSWRRKLAAGEVVLLDGGTGSDLRRRGVPMNAAAWAGLAAYTHPEAVRCIHQDYIDAGAEVIIANTFGSSRFLLEAAGFGDQFETVNRRAVAVAMEARRLSGKRPDDVAVAGSLANLPPNMDTRQYPPPHREKADLNEQARLLATAGVDVIALEMMQDTHHAALAMAAALDTGLPVWLGVSACLRGSGSLTSFDFPHIDFADVLDALIPMRPAVVNIMHTELAAVAPAIDAVGERFAGPIGAYPEIPYQTVPNGSDDPAGTPAAFAALAKRWVARGARLLGGCCGTTPSHIAALRASYRTYLTVNPNVRRAPSETM